MDEWRKLASAVIKQAVKDYVVARLRLIQNPNDCDAMYLKKDCDNFFRSDHFTLFSQGIDGTALLHDLSTEMQKWGGNGKMNAPCKDCKRRHKGCHSECMFYTAYARERRRVLKIGAKINQTRNDYMAWQVKRKDERK